MANLSTEKFFERIHYQGSHNVTFEDLPSLQLQFTKAIPFENMDVMRKDHRKVTLENVKKKIIDQKRGGICYELNPLFYWFLQQQGFKVYMVAGTVIRDGEPRGPIGTHVTTLLLHNEEPYIVDVGFGSNLALQPIPMTGQTVSSFTGEYRIQKTQTPWGDYTLEKYQNGELKVRYSFSTKPVDETYLDQVKDQITHHEQSPFNKSILLTKLIDNGHITLTEQSLTTTKNQQRTQQKIDQHLFQELCQRHFGIAPLQESC
ncbi:arylamine N-acetyltransferase family protein [Melghirimyces algeriensis]|uniref:N-hydroxyarylamine O-acetyltransferase n=1 Tax=Melghirimyces algeriensis TaxID=910412 RepID=A0A521AB32_9BACL|nr:arylamine N-acetyltransferase [Melghirimyces algeriensis]SMO32023.1 N-hydroxyarylamine O-acetyltransferase [Melghirimyces algeriensis]